MSTCTIRMRVVNNALIIWLVIAALAIWIPAARSVRWGWQGLHCVGMWAHHWVVRGRTKDWMAMLRWVWMVPWVSLRILRVHLHVMGWRRIHAAGCTVAVVSRRFLGVRSRVVSSYMMAVRIDVCWMVGSPGVHGRVAMHLDRVVRSVGMVHRRVMHARGRQTWWVLMALVVRATSCVNWLMMLIKDNLILRPVEMWCHWRLLKMRWRCKVSMPAKVVLISSQMDRWRHKARGWKAMVRWWVVEVVLGVGVVDASVVWMVRRIWSMVGVIRRALRATLSSHGCRLAI